MAQKRAMECCSTATKSQLAIQHRTRQRKLAGFVFATARVWNAFQEQLETASGLQALALASARHSDSGEPSGVGVGVAVGVGVGFGVGLGLMSVGPFGVAVGVGLGLGAKSGVGETVGVGVGDELCAKALRGGRNQPARIRNSKQKAAITARTSSVLAHRNRTTQNDARLCRVVGPGICG